MERPVAELELSGGELAEETIKLLHYFRSQTGSIPEVKSTKKTRQGRFTLQKEGASFSVSIKFHGRLQMFAISRCQEVDGNVQWEGCKVSLGEFTGGHVRHWTEREGEKQIKTPSDTQAAVHSAKQLIAQLK